MMIFAIPVTISRQVFNADDTFDDIDECVDFITEIKQEKIFMIVSEALNQTTVPIVHDTLQLMVIYIFFCENEARHEI
jgi:hypothetical protein